MLKGQCQKFLINRKCQKQLMFLQGGNGVLQRCEKQPRDVQNAARTVEMSASAAPVPCCVKC